MDQSPAEAAPRSLTPPRRLGGGTVLLGLVAVVVVVFGIVAVGSLLGVRRYQPPLLSLGAMPSFSFTNEAGQPATDADLRGHVVVVNLIFTRCDTICPINSVLMAKLQDETSDVAEQLKLISVSIDPSYDTPERLAAYAKRYGARPGRWQFLTGDFAQIRSVMEDGLKLAIEQERGVVADGDVPAINHSGHFVLLDQQLQIRGYYDSKDPAKMQELPQHARYLVRHGVQGR